MSLLWQPAPLAPHAIAGVPYAGFRIDAQGRRYWLRHTEPGAARRYDAGDVSALYRFTPNVGVAVTARDGRLPPLFKVQRTLDLSVALVY